MRAPVMQVTLHIKPNSIRQLPMNLRRGQRHQPRAIRTPACSRRPLRQRSGRLARRTKIRGSVMKKFVLIAAAAAVISAASAITPANALSIIKPGCCGGGGGFYPGGGFHPHFGGGVSIGVGFNSGYAVGAPVIGSDCFYVRRKALVPGVGVVSKRQLVCG